MKNIQPTMNVGKQRRKLEQLYREAPHDNRPYIAELIHQFDLAVSAGQPRPASEFIPMYQEEFGL